MSNDLSKSPRGVTGNALKLIALISMTVDHAGLILLGNPPLCRILGRLAFPLFAWSVAEGCLHTRSRRRYFRQVTLLGLLCQLVYYFVDGTLYMSVLISFSMAIPGVYLLLRAKRERRSLPWLCLTVYVALTYFICEILPGLLDPALGFCVDYGFWGVMLPLLAAAFEENYARLGAFTLGLTALCLSLGGLEWYALLSLPLLLLYNGQRGRRKLKYLFYIYYPLHLAALYGLSMLLV